MWNNAELIFLNTNNLHCTCTQQPASLDLNSPVPELTIKDQEVKRLLWSPMTQWAEYIFSWSICFMINTSIFNSLSSGWDFSIWPSSPWETAVKTRFILKPKVIKSIQNAPTFLFFIERRHYFNLPLNLPSILLTWKTGFLKFDV